MNIFMRILFLKITIAARRFLVFARLMPPLEYHPIQNMDAIDVLCVRKGGGADLVIIVSCKLAGDSDSQKLLMNKVEVYLGYINSKEYTEEFNAPSPENTCIIVQCVEEPDPEIRQLVEKMKPWVKENNASVCIKVG